MISIKKNPVIKLNIPSFQCDENPVSEHLNSHPLTALLNVYGFLCVIGRPGSGKTSLTISFITQKKPNIYRKTHHHLLIIMPQNSIDSLKENPFKKLDPDNIYGDLTDDSITQVYNKINGFSAENEKTILLIDDMTASLKASKFIQETLKKLIYNRRHLKLNIIITAQSFCNIPLDVRKNIQNLILFKPAKKEFELVFDELFESKKDLFLKIMKLTYDQKHNFLFMNVPTQRLFKNWDEVLINDTDEN
jgi:adenylate kinase family enzyme